MAKRTRGSNRPGQRHAERHSSARPVSRPVSALSESEEARAAELESQIVAQERVADVSRNRAKERAHATEPARPGRAGGQGLLAVKAAEEYAYVVRDVRRILVVGGAVAVAMVAFYILIDVAHVISIS